MTKRSLQFGIFPKVLGSLVGIAALTSAVSLYISHQADLVREASERVFTNHFEPTTVVEGADDDIQRYRARAMRHILDTSAASVLERIAKNISGVALAAGQTANGAGQGQKAASNLSSMAGSQQAMLVQFQLT